MWYMHVFVLRCVHKITCNWTTKRDKILLKFKIRRTYETVFYIEQEKF
jgi:hypothetical protein